MAKTAEEIIALTFLYDGVMMDDLNGFAVQRAAQEVEAYKERLKAEVKNVILNERKVDYLTGRHIYQLIDTVK